MPEIRFHGATSGARTVHIDDLTLEAGGEHVRVTEEQHQRLKDLDGHKFTVKSNTKEKS